MRFLFAFVILLASCAEVKTSDFPQVCDMCGSKYLVTPLDPNEKVPPRVEWCFNDGAYCDDGIGILLRSNTPSNSLDREWLNHCLSCKGCRCAAFTPDKWRIIMRAVREARGE